MTNISQVNIKCHHVRSSAVARMSFRVQTVYVTASRRTGMLKHVVSDSSTIKHDRQLLMESYEMNQTS